MLNLSLQQKLLQKLTPQQIQVMKLLQLPVAQLEQRIKEELETNPALEESEDELDFADNTEDINTEDLNTDADSETEDAMEAREEKHDEDKLREDDVDITEYYDEDEEGVAEYKLQDPSEFHDPDDDNKTIPVAVSSSFQEFLESQLGLLNLNDHQLEIAEHLIGSLDEDGYLRRSIDAIVDDLAFRQNVMTSENEVLDILRLIQKFDPPGVGARTLSECLLIQLLREDGEISEPRRLAILIIEKHFDIFVKKHYEKLERALGCGNDMLKHAVEEITKLNPKPGSAFSSGLQAEQYIIPDFIVSNSNGELTLSLNGKNMPELRISNSFREMVHDYKSSKIKSKQQKEAILFIKQKIDAAKWFIDAIHQRQQTLLVTMQAILEFQYNYFLTGDEARLKPMILKDIAEKTGLDISTISRVSNSKYVQTEFGTLQLKYFFSEGLMMEDGEEISTREVKNILEKLIGEEDKSDPISDQKLTELLVEKGYNVARRTVAKYREQLNIPVARLRKEL